jgi:hypothetical protein
VGRGRESDRAALDCTGQEKAAHGHVSYVVQTGSKNSVKGKPKTASFVPEMSVVGASKFVAGALAAVYDHKDPFPPSPTTLTTFYPLL